MTADRSPDATADAAAAAGSGHLTDADREALTAVCWLETKPHREWAMYLNDAEPIVEAIVQRAVTAALNDAADAIEAAEKPWHRAIHGVPAEMSTHYEEAARIVRART